MKILFLERAPEKQLIEQAVKTLEAGGLIIYPTETCYGIGADALDPKAIDKLLKYKGGRKGKPISIAVANQKMAKQYTKINPTAQNIFHNLLPGPITVVCEGKHKVDPRLESQSGTLGIRIPDYPLILKIIKTFGKPITATSANISSGKAPYSIKNILDNLPGSRKRLISLVIDAGVLPSNPPSTVIDTTQDQPKILRQGKINFSRLRTRSVISNSTRETKQLAEQMIKKQSKYLKDKCLIFALQGELGVGKTQFAKGIGKALAITKTIKSPTFIIIHEHPFKFKKIKGIFYHIDAWRLRNPNELLELGIKQMIKPGNIIAIEWIEKGKKILKKHAPKFLAKIIYLDFQHLAKNKRRIKFVI